MTARDSLHVRHWRAADFPGLIALAERASVGLTRRMLEAQLDHQRLSALRPDQHVYVRMIAEVDGTIVGTAVAHDQIFVPRGWLIARVFVDDRYRCRGVGSTLASALEAGLEGRPPGGLVGRVREGDPVARAWADRHGFRPALREVTCILDPLAAPATIQSDRRLECDGLQFFSMAEAGGRADWPRLYELVANLLSEIPQMSGAPGPSKEAVENSFTHRMLAAPEATWVAAQGGQLTPILHEMTGGSRSGMSGWSWPIRLCITAFIEWHWLPFSVSWRSNAVSGRVS